MRKVALLLQKTLPARLWVAALSARNRLRAALHEEPYRSVLPYTMMSLPRLQNLRRLAEEIDAAGIEGDVVECGTCNGGSGALLASVAQRSPLARHVWLLDSFAGLPSQSTEDGRWAARYTGACRGDPKRVSEVLRRVGVPASAFTVVKGWFADTLPTLAVGRIALLHIDADLYASVRLVLEHLYDRVADGGFVILDDFGTWEGCRRACADFFEARGLSVTLRPVDGHAVYFRVQRGAAQ